MMPANKCLIVIGPEGTGSKLIARTLAHALGIKNFKDWAGNGWIDNGTHKVCHRSLPFGTPPVFPDLNL